MTQDEHAHPRTVTDLIAMLTSWEQACGVDVPLYMVVGLEEVVGQGASEEVDYCVIPVGAFLPMPPVEGEDSPALWFISTNAWRQRPALQEQEGFSTHWEEPDAAGLDEAPLDDAEEPDDVAPMTIGDFRRWLERQTPEYATAHVPLCMLLSSSDLPEPWASQAETPFYRVALVGTFLCSALEDVGGDDPLMLLISTVIQEEFLSLLSRQS
jgi:hypothetical protein